MKFFRGQGNFFREFRFQKWVYNEFEENNERSCSWLKKQVPLKIDFKAEWTHEFLPTAWEFKN